LRRLLVLKATDIGTIAVPILLGSVGAAGGPGFGKWKIYI